MKNTSSSPLHLLLLAFAFLTLDAFGASAKTADFVTVKVRATQGEAQAQWELGRRYEHGIGVARSSRKAVQWYRKAAEQNLPRAQYSLGRLFAAGDGVRQDFTRALQWFHRAAAQGYALAQNRLGVIYQRGRGVAPDPVEAFKWFALAAANNQAGPASANLHALAARLTPEQLTVAERRIHQAEMPQTNLGTTK